MSNRYRSLSTPKVELIPVTGDTALSIDVALETERLDRYLPLLRVHGKVFTNCVFPYGQYPIAEKDSRCFDEALKLALSAPGELHYVEGIVLVKTKYKGRGNVPLAHGWCSTVDGRIVDPTMHSHQHKFQFDYFGMPLRVSYVLEESMATGYIGCLDGRLDGSSGGVYHDNVDLWLDTGVHT